MNQRNCPNCVAPYADTTSAYDIWGSKICTFTKGYNLTTNIGFEAVASSKHKHLCTIEVAQ